MYIYFIVVKNLNVLVVKKFKFKKNYMYQFYEDMFGKRKIKEYNVNFGNNYCFRYFKIVMIIKYF